MTNKLAGGFIGTPTPLPPTFVRLSKKRSTKETFKLLNKNLNFVPTQTNFNKTKLNKELEDFYKHIKVKAHLKNPENKSRSTEEDIFRKPANKTWFSNNNHHSIETRNEINNEIEKTKRPSYSNLSVKEQKALQELQCSDDILIVEAHNEEDIFRKPANKTWFSYNNHHSIETRNEINNEIEKTKRPSYSNLSVKEQKALQELQCSDDILIVEAHKGGAIVILDVEDYIKVAEKQLHNTESYKKLNYNPTTTNNEKVDKIIRFHKTNLISKNIMVPNCATHHIFNSTNYLQTKGNYLWELSMGTICAP